MNNHVSQQHSNTASSFYKHKLHTEHDFRDFDLFILLADLEGKFSMRSWESFFIERLSTLEPNGLNIIF
jgi:hypothetical protein